MPSSVFVILLSYISLFCLGFLDNHRGPFYQQIMMDLGLNDTQISSFFTVTSIVAFVASYQMPWLLKKWRPMWVFRGSLVFFGLGFILISLSRTWSFLLLASSVFGAAFGVLTVVQNLMIYVGSQEKNRSRLYSGLHSMYAFAALLAPLSINFFLNLGWGWRGTFRWISLVPFVTVIFSFFKNVNLSTQGQKYMKQESQEERQVKKKSRSEWWWAHYVAFIFSLYISSEIVVASRMVVLAERTLGLSLSEANRYLTFFFVALLLGRLILTAVPVKRALVMILIVELLGSGLFVTLGLFDRMEWLIVSGFFMSAVFPLSLEYISRYFPSTADYVISITMAFGSLTVVLAHFLVGYFTDIWGIQQALYLAPVFLTLSLFLFMIGHHVRTRTASN